MSARELGIATIAIYTQDDPNHAAVADEAVLLDAPEDFIDINKIVRICRVQKADALHPAYGFLSENPSLVEQLTQAGITFVGPTAQMLRETGDKTHARSLAIRNGVPVLAASDGAISSLGDAKAFIHSVGYPVMIKAVDGGGGRGIRLVERAMDLESSFSRACGESPSGQVFLEKAAIDGFRHVEVQIIGDNYGEVTHLWERECSIQRRFQKVIELAPSMVTDRRVIQDVINGALRLARCIRYQSLGTLEFLVHESSGEYYFLEVNPRLQVEHTITEEVAGIDIVRSQLLLALGTPLADLDLPSRRFPDSTSMRQYAIELRVTAENAKKDFQLSMGRISRVILPEGQGVRVDTHLRQAENTTVGPAYDSLLAKLIIRASSFEVARVKAIRALLSFQITGVETNIPVLLGVLQSEDFTHGACSTRWLETNLPTVLHRGSEAISRYAQSKRAPLDLDSDNSESLTNAPGANGVLFRKGDRFKIRLEETKDSEATAVEEYLVKVDRIRTNNFPTEVCANVTLIPSARNLTQRNGIATVQSSMEASVASAAHPMGNISDPRHVCLPFSGQFLQLAVEEGDEVSENDLLCVVKQMKMELEVRAPNDAVVSWVCQVEEGETVKEGMLVCVLDWVDKNAGSQVGKAESLAKL